MPYPVIGLLLSSTMASAAIVVSPVSVIGNRASASLNALTMDGR
jgi:hypothetical protein